MCSVPHFPLGLAPPQARQPTDSECACLPACLLARSQAQEHAQAEAAAAEAERNAAAARAAVRAEQVWRVHALEQSKHDKCGEVMLSPMTIARTILVKERLLLLLMMLDFEVLERLVVGLLVLASPTPKSAPFNDWPVKPSMGDSMPQGRSCTCT
jgi:hypothetical protein